MPWLRSTVGQAPGTSAQLGSKRQRGHLTKEKEDYPSRLLTLSIESSAPKSPENRRFLRKRSSYFYGMTSLIFSKTQIINLINYYLSNRSNIHCSIKTRCPHRQGPIRLWKSLSRSQDIICAATLWVINWFLKGTIPSLSSSLIIVVWELHSEITLWSLESSSSRLCAPCLAEEA